MDIDRDIQLFQAVLEQKGTFLSWELRNNNTADKKSLLTVSSDQTDDIRIISNSEIPADLVLFNIFGTDRKDDLSLVAEFFQKTEFTVGFKSRKNAGGVVVVKELSAKFKVKLSTKFSDAVSDMLGLHF